MSIDKLWKRCYCYETGKEVRSMKEVADQIGLKIDGPNLIIRAIRGDEETEIVLDRDAAEAAVVKMMEYLRKPIYNVKNEVVDGYQ